MKCDILEHMSMSCNYGLRKVQEGIGNSFVRCFHHTFKSKKFNKYAGKKIMVEWECDNGGRGPYGERSGIARFYAVSIENCQQYKEIRKKMICKCIKDWGYKNWMEIK